MLEVSLNKHGIPMEIPGEEIRMQFFLTLLASATFLLEKQELTSIVAVIVVLGSVVGMAVN